MGVWATVFSGVICGCAGALPQAYLFEGALRGQESVSMARGVLSVLVSFATLTLLLLVVWLVAPEEELVFGGAMVSAYLVLWSIEAVRAWRSANAA